MVDDALAAPTADALADEAAPDGEVGEGRGLPAVMAQEAEEVHQEIPQIWTMVRPHRRQWERRTLMGPTMDPCQR